MQLRQLCLPYIPAVLCFLSFHGSGVPSPIQKSIFPMLPTLIHFQLLTVLFSHLFLSFPFLSLPQQLLLNYEVSLSLLSIQFIYSLLSLYLSYVIVPFPVIQYPITDLSSLVSTHIPTNKTVIQLLLRGLITYKASFVLRITFLMMPPPVLPGVNANLPVSDFPDSTLTPISITRVSSLSSTPVFSVGVSPRLILSSFLLFLLCSDLPLLYSEGELIARPMHLCAQYRILLLPGPRTILHHYQRLHVSLRNSTHWIHFESSHLLEFMLHLGPILQQLLSSFVLEFINGYLLFSHSFLSFLFLSLTQQLLLNHDVHFSSLSIQYVYFLFSSHLSYVIVIFPVIQYLITDLYSLVSIRIPANKTVIQLLLSGLITYKVPFVLRITVLAMLPPALPRRNTEFPAPDFPDSTLTLISVTGVTPLSSEPIALVEVSLGIILSTFATFLLCSNPPFPLSAGENMILRRKSFLLFIFIQHILHLLPVSRQARTRLDRSPPPAYKHNPSLIPSLRVITVLRLPRGFRVLALLDELSILILRELRIPPCPRPPLTRFDKIILVWNNNLTPSSYFLVLSCFLPRIFPVDHYFLHQFFPACNEDILLAIITLATAILCVRWPFRPSSSCLHLLLTFSYSFLLILLLNDCISLPCP